MSLVNAATTASTTRHRIASQAIVLLWIIFLGWAIWRHAERSHVPPIYDGLAYFQKAKNVWQHLGGKNFVNPLSAPPSYRPPGTVLMSYPFGYDDDFRGFHFRSVFIPVLCFLTAIYIAGYSAARSAVRLWLLALGAIFFSTLPFFYHFEYTDYSLHDWAVPTYYWGLVDAFLGGVSALAAAAAVRGVANLSLKWFSTAFTLASFCLLIKPAGILTMALIAAAWVLSVVVHWFHAGSLSQIRSRIVRGSAVLLLIYGVTLIACFKSTYLSASNLQYGRTALRIIRTEYWIPITVPLLRDFLSCSLGYPLLAGAVVLCIVAALGRKDPRVRSSLDRRVEFALLLSAVLALAVGVWFWLHEAVITQVRFFMPLAMMAAVFTMPIALVLMERYRRLTQVLVIVAGVQVLNLALLLAQTDPSPAWQKVSGVYLSAGCCDAEVAQAQELLAESRKAGRNIRLYAFDNSGKLFSFLSVGYYASLLNPEAPSFTIQFPISWESATAIRISDLVTADYLLIKPLNDSDARRHILSQTGIDDFHEESLLFQAALSDRPESNGLRRTSESSLLLLQVVDRDRLRKAVAALQNQHTWREAFVKANQSPCLVSAEALPSASAPPALRRVVFEDKFELESLRMYRNNGITNLRISWKPLRSDATSGWKLFVHELDPQGRILVNREIAAGIEDQHGKQCGLLSASIAFPSSASSHPSGIGVGFYRATPAGLELLRAETGKRDLGDKRVLVPYDGSDNN